MDKLKTVSDLGKFKEEIHAALYKNSDIKELIIEDIENKSRSEILIEFMKHVKSHLFIDDTIEEADSFIYYDVIMPSLHTQTKNCRVIMYIICHRDILDNYYKEGYYGNRADVLAQMVENALINDEQVANSFGIGRINLDGIDLYNSTRFYGRILTFDVPNFR